ncbi:MAG: hypothetical protein C1942_08960 [Prosthecochloris sp.]|uniref:Uncharacterized protein n=1 Tax=Prosthecochloris aestuarii (strain DSM 271 / SK 413) TaxID=290512 RepID=B4S537_PROA2|nr:hypothetical protein Paes_1971 [Prosthecochloris aestuarii DSM 271]NEX12794.1 hypothetical protein [Prosthecochloris sp.]
MVMQGGQQILSAFFLHLKAEKHDFLFMYGLQILFYKGFMVNLRIVNNSVIYGWCLSICRHLIKSCLALSDCQVSSLPDSYQLRLVSAMEDDAELC